MVVVICFIIWIVIIFCMIIFDDENVITLKQCIYLSLLVDCCICLGINMNICRSSNENKKVEKKDTIKQDTIYIDDNVLILDIKDR